LEGLIKHGRNWGEISALVKNRSSPQCRSHAQKFLLKMSLLGLHLKFLQKHNANEIHIQYEPALDIQNDRFLNYYFENDTFFKNNQSNLNESKENEFTNKIYADAEHKMMDLAGFGLDLKYYTNS
jgi:hypothetical protein